MKTVVICGADVGLNHSMHVAIKRILEANADVVHVITGIDKATIVNDIKPKIFELNCIEHELPEIKVSDRYYLQLGKYQTRKGEKKLKNWQKSKFNQ